MNPEEPRPAVRTAVRAARTDLDRGDRDAALARLGALDTEGMLAADWTAVGGVYLDAEHREAARRAGKRALALTPRDRRALELASTPYLVDGQEHWVPLIGANARSWRTMGILALWLGILCTVAIAIVVPLQPIATGAKGEPIIKPKGDLASFLTIAAYFAISVYGLTWMVFDILDRRGRWAWIVFFPVFFIFGVPWLALLLYRWLQPRLTVAKRPFSA